VKTPNDGANQREMGKKALQFHLNGPDKSKNTTHRGARLLGKEYLFASIGVLALAWKLVDFVKASDYAGKYKEHSKTLSRNFGRVLGESEVQVALGKDTDGEPSKDFSFLRFFHRQKIEEDSWVRIPAGTVHAWLGGGNLLIELGDRSDNTFRMLDYGREISADARDMHYLAAMCSLNATSFFPDGEEHKLIERLPDPSVRKACHPQLDYMVYRLPKGKSVEHELEAHSFLMNPEGGLTVKPVLAGPNLEIGRFSAVIARDKVKVRLWTEHEGNRVFHFIPRQTKEA
jgi:hypothetical protein